MWVLNTARISCSRAIVGVKDDRVREKLLGKRDLDLDKDIETIKASQVTYSRVERAKNLQRPKK